MILCCGEALIDMLPRTLAEGGTGFKPVAGGAVFNTAIALGRLGAPVGFFSQLSRDMFAPVLMDALTASHVDYTLCRRVAHPTTLAFVSLAGGDAEYAFFDENSAGRLLSDVDLPGLGDDIDALLFGAISLIGEPCGSAYEALLMREHGTRLIYLDPNIRPGFITDEAAHRARLARMIARSDIIKVSDDDLVWLADGADGQDLIGDWLSGGAALVLQTKGADGAVAYRRDDTIAAGGVAASVVDTVGAGDTFNAGVLAGLNEAGALSKTKLRALDRAALEHALGLGVRAAAVTVSRPGADPPWRQDIP